MQSLSVTDRLFAVMQNDANAFVTPIIWITCTVNQSHGLGVTLLQH